MLRGVRGILRIYFDPEVVEPRVETLEDVDLAEGPAVVRRVVFAFRNRPGRVPSACASNRKSIG